MSITKSVISETSISFTYCTCQCVLMSQWCVNVVCVQSPVFHAQQPRCHILWVLGNDLVVYLVIVCWFVLLFALKTCEKSVVLQLWSLIWWNLPLYVNVSCIYIVWSLWVGFGLCLLTVPFCT